MKKILILFMFILFFSPQDVLAKLKIERTWVEGSYIYVLITYTNDANTTYKNSVTIECAALDQKDNKININSRSFFCHEYGPIQPGFEGTLKIPINLYGVNVKSVSCKCKEW